MTASITYIHTKENVFKRLFKRVKTSVRKYREVNRTISELSKLSDHELNDIGISRCEIRRVANEIYYDDLIK